MKRAIGTDALLQQPGVAGVCDKDFTLACQALEKIATGRSGRDTTATAQIMRDIAMEALIAVKYGDYGSTEPPAASVGKQ